MGKVHPRPHTLLDWGPDKWGFEVLVLCLLVLPCLWLWWRSARRDKPGNSFRIRWVKVIVVGAMSALLAGALCIGVSLVYHSKSVNRTHCSVPNVLPSISAAIGNKTPERYIWRVGIALEMWPALLGGLATIHLLSRYLEPGRLTSWQLSMLTYTQFGEVLSLGCLTFVSSSENFPLHERGFVFWFLFSAVRMIIMLWAIRRTDSNRFAFKFRLGCFLSFSLFFVLAICCYLYHMSVCVPYLYSAFALCEWIVVVCNISFNVALYWEYDDVALVLVDNTVAKFD